MLYDVKDLLGLLRAAILRLFADDEVKINVGMDEMSVGGTTHLRDGMREREQTTHMNIEEGTWNDRERERERERERANEEEVTGPRGNHVGRKGRQGSRISFSCACS